MTVSEPTTPCHMVCLLWANQAHEGPAVTVHPVQDTPRARLSLRKYSLLLILYAMICMLNLSFLVRPPMGLHPRHLYLARVLHGVPLLQVIRHNLPVSTPHHPAQTSHRARPNTLPVLQPTLRPVQLVGDVRGLQARLTVQREFTARTGILESR